MFALFKKRDFGDYVSDTFQFFRQTGKHYLKGLVYYSRRENDENISSKDSIDLIGSE